MTDGYCAARTVPLHTKKWLDSNITTINLLLYKVICQDVSWIKTFIVMVHCLVLLILTWVSATASIILLLISWLRDGVSGSDWGVRTAFFCSVLNPVLDQDSGGELEWRQEGEISFLSLLTGKRMPDKRRPGCESPRAGRTLGSFFWMYILSMSMKVKDPRELQITAGASYSSDPMMGEKMLFSLESRGALTITPETHLRSLLV